MNDENGYQRMKLFIIFIFLIQPADITWHDVRYLSLFMLINSCFVLLWQNMEVDKLKCIHTWAHTHTHIVIQSADLQCGSTCHWKISTSKEIQTAMKPITYNICNPQWASRTVSYIVLTSWYSGIHLFDSEACAIYSLPWAKFLWRGHIWTRIPELSNLISSNQNDLWKGWNCKMSASTYVLIILCFKICTVGNTCS